jgi:phosphoglycerate kinase
LENLRQHEGEESNNEAFAKELSSLGDIYINEAFSASHRAHTSIAGVSRLLPSYAGLLFVEEYENLSKVFNAPKPFTVIMGGAKFSTKLPVIKKLAPPSDNIFLGGALVHVLWKKMGYEVGQSLVDDSVTDLDDILKLKNVHLPQDVVVQGEDGDKLNKLPDQVGVQDVISDAGSKTVVSIIKSIKESQFIFWNGPLGFIEKGFMGSSQEIIEAIGKSRAYSIVGGGDTVAVVNTLKAFDNFDFVSTAGGASLEFVANGTLVGIEVLKDR